MHHLGEAEVREKLEWAVLVEAISNAVLDPRYASPSRVRHDLWDEKRGEQGALLLMPGWHGGDVIGLKTVMVWPGNPELGLPSHCANYIVMSARSGELLGILHGGELTLRRTAAVSALAIRKLRRADAQRLLVIGTGPVARNVVLCQAALGSFERIEIYGRNEKRARELVEELGPSAAACSVSHDLERSVRDADVISTATSAAEPVFDGNWVRPGTHVDLIGSFKPQMREADDRLMERTASIWVDTAMAKTESGDLVKPLDAGVIKSTAIAGDLRELLSKEGSRRTALSDITVFKAVGFSLPDLAAAQLALARTSPAVGSE